MLGCKTFGIIIEGKSKETYYVIVICNDKKWIEIIDASVWYAPNRFFLLI